MDRKVPNTIRILAGIRSDLLYAVSGNMAGTFVDQSKLESLQTTIEDMLIDWNSRHVGDAAMTVAGIPHRAASTSMSWKCDTCRDTGEIDETLGGHARSNPHAPCPDCVAPVPKYVPPPPRQ